jgi:hypothetical protein
MTDKHPKITPEPMKPDEAAQLRRLLETSDIAPVDQRHVGRRLAEIIMGVCNEKKAR